MYMAITFHYTLIMGTGIASKPNIHYAVLLDLSKCCIITSFVLLYYTYSNEMWR
jgi:hypothetical protein